MDHYLIEHCAPTLASIKTANLFRVSFDTQKNLFDAVRRWNNTLRDKGVLCFCLCLHEHTDVTTFTAAEFDADKMDEFDAIAFGCPSMGAEQLEEDEFEPMFTACEELGKALA